MAALLLAAAPARAQTPGAPGLGDPYFPLAGNGGYEVDHYDLTLTFRPKSGRIHAAAAISATSTQALSAFNLDFRGLRVEAVSVDGAPAGVRREGAEMTILPAAPIASGKLFHVLVSYHGRPRPLKPGASPFPTGWIPTRDGAFVASEPRGAMTWFPCNDHPTDKASYSFTVTVPKGRVAAANGNLESVSLSGPSRTFVWRETEPMATYLATVTTGRFRLRGGSASGIPSITVVVPGHRRQTRKMLGVIPAALSRLSSYFGPYPFSSTGAIIDTGFPDTALETQTRPLYGAFFEKITVVHELSHQWFGDAVSVRRWSDIWLNEGFATWSEWLWESGGKDARLRKLFRSIYRLKRIAKPLWKVPPGAPGRKKMFSLSVYVRGALTLEALRQTIGDVAFYAVMRRWVPEHLYGTASTQDFIELAESVSGRQLDRFFDLWLFGRSKPRNWQ